MNALQWQTLRYGADTAWGIIWCASCASHHACDRFVAGFRRHDLL